MAEISIPRAPTLVQAVSALGVMADNANMVFDEERALAFKAICMSGFVDAILFVHKVLPDDFFTEPSRSLTFAAVGCFSAGVEHVRIDDALQDASRLDSVNFKIDPEANVSCVRNQDSGECEARGDNIDSHVGLMRIQSPLVDLDAAKYVYDAVVGIPSDMFEKFTGDLQNKSDMGTP